MAARSLRRSRVPVLLRGRQADAARHGRGEDIVRPAPDDRSLHRLRSHHRVPSPSHCRLRSVPSPGNYLRPFHLPVLHRRVRQGPTPATRRPSRPLGRRTPTPTPLLWFGTGRRPRCRSSPTCGEDRFAAGVDHNSQDPLSRPLKIAYAVVFVVLVVSVLGLVYVHFHHTGGRHPTQADGPRRRHRLPRRRHTVALPTALKPGAEDAATALVSSWAAGNRAAALTVATPAAVTTLFAAPYASGLAIDRGCSTSFTPIVCTFGPPGRCLAD